jgi:hypothetical protein
MATNSVTGKTLSRDEELGGKGRQIGIEMAVRLLRKRHRGWNTRGWGLVWICMYRGDKSASRLNWIAKWGENDVIQRLCEVIPRTIRSKLRVLPEKLTVPQLVKKFPAFYWTRKLNAAFTSARHLSKFRARWIQSMPLHLTSQKSILILPFHLSLGLLSNLCIFYLIHYLRLSTCIIV